MKITVQLVVCDDDGHEETFTEDVPSSKCFGFVQTLDTKPKRRLFEVLQSQGTK